MSVTVLTPVISTVSAHSIRNQNRQCKKCFSDEICDNVRVLYSSSSRRDEMFIGRKFQKIFLAPEERNLADLAYHRRKHCAPLERESCDL